MKRLLVAMGLLLAMSAMLFAGAQGETEAAAEEMRPVWVWGVPAWAGDYDPEVLDVANAWAMENFGVTFKITSGVPQDMTRDQALQLVIAEGEFPDIINGDSLSTMVELAEGGRLMQLDRFLEDPENFPVYANADRASLLKYRVNGKLYAFPGFGWRVESDAPAWVYPMWIMRHDVYKEHGYPKTSQDLMKQMRWVKQTALPDAEGNPTIPLGLQGGHSMGTLRLTIYQFKGAGFEIDPQKRLMPPWASEQAYEALKMFNTMWREQLLNPGLFVQNNEKFQDDLRFLRYAFDCGSTWNIALSRSQIQKLQEKHGRDSKEVQDYAQMQHIMLVNPIQENPGRVGNGGYGGPPPPVYVSVDTPNPDGAVGYLHYLLTDEGYISVQNGAGYRGVHWDWTNDERVWAFKDEYMAEKEHVQQTSKGFNANSWVSNEAAHEEGKKPYFPPVVFYLSYKAYSSQVHHLRPVDVNFLYGENGKFPIFAGLEPGAPTALEWGYPFSVACLDVVAPYPSYVMVTTPQPPMELTAQSTADERFDGGIAKLITAPSEDAFEAEYNDFINTLIRVTNWKPIYEARQQRWLDWMKSNNIDDRADLKTVDPIPEWKEVMGW